jgi:hypothetical protein
MPLPGAGADVATVLNGLFGDDLPERGSPLAIPLTFRTATTHELPMDRALANHPVVYDEITRWWD